LCEVISWDDDTNGMIAGGLIYFIVPTDFILDFLPFVGYLDDLAVLTAVINSLQEELTVYREWRIENN